MFFLSEAVLFADHISYYFIKASCDSCDALNQLLIVGVGRVFVIEQFHKS